MKKEEKLKRVISLASAGTSSAPGGKPLLRLNKETVTIYINNYGPGHATKQDRPIPSLNGVDCPRNDSMYLYCMPEPDSSDICDIIVCGQI
jgi:hypothetical protein